MFKKFSYYPGLLLKHLNNIKNITIVIKLFMFHEFVLLKK